LHEGSRLASLAALLVVEAAMLGFFVVSAPAAGACSCVGGATVASRVRGADAVYVARARTAHLSSSVSFRVVRVLKGETKHNVRVRVRGGDGGACGTPLLSTPYVLTAHDGRFAEQSLCNREMSGPKAVQVATSILGPGQPVAARLDPVWVLQWVLLVVLVLALGLAGTFVATRRRTPPTA
jgi:hypothetical protein